MRLLLAVDDRKMPTVPSGTSDHHWDAEYGAGQNLLNEGISNRAATGRSFPAAVPTEVTSRDNPAKPPPMVMARI